MINVSKLVQSVICQQKSQKKQIPYNKKSQESKKPCVRPCLISFILSYILDFSRSFVRTFRCVDVYKSPFPHSLTDWLTICMLRICSYRSPGHLFYFLFSNSCYSLWPLGSEELLARHPLQLDLGPLAELLVLQPLAYLPWLGLVFQSIILNFGKDFPFIFIERESRGGGQKSRNDSSKMLSFACLKLEILFYKCHW